MNKLLLLLILLIGCEKPTVTLAGDCRRDPLTAYKTLRYKASSLCYKKGTFFFSIKNLDAQQCKNGYMWTGTVYCHKGNPRR